MDREEEGQAAADRAVMGLEAMAFNWIATTDIHKAIAAAATTAGPRSAKLAAAIHGLVSQAWIEGADTGFAARRELTDAAREKVADLEATFEMMWAADMRAVELWRAAHPGNDLVLPDRAKLTLWLLEQIPQSKGPIP